MAKVRINELVTHSDPAHADQLPVYVASTGKTRKISLLELYNFIYSGEGGGSYAPVYLGGSVVYDVPELLDGATTVAIPSLAGKDFLLRRQGRPMLPGTEYEILTAGGFKLKLPDDVLFAGERFELDVFSLQTGPAPTPGTGGGSGITGVVPITVNTPLNATDHLNKLLQIRSGSTAVSLTLFNLADPDVPDFTIVEIESLINTTRQCSITTQESQNIYMRGASYTTIYIAPGETTRLFKGEDGWYVLDNGLPQIYDRLGMIEAVYKVGRNQLLCDGSLYSRAAYPRLWEIVQSFGSSLVSDAVWSTASVVVDGVTVENPYRGCFSTGNGTDTFRVPNLKNVALRGLLGAADPQRHHNFGGGFQKNRMPAHTHTVPVDATSDAGTGAIAGGAPNAPDATINTGSAGGGTETRMDNVGVLWAINV